MNVLENFEQEEKQTFNERSNSVPLVQIGSTILDAISTWLEHLESILGHSACVAKINFPSTAARMQHKNIAKAAPFSFILL